VKIFVTVLSHRDWFVFNKVRNPVCFQRVIASEKRSNSRVKFLKFPTVEPLWNTAFPDDLLDGLKKISHARERLRKVPPALLSAFWWNGIKRPEIF